jgi:hypothetical protein
MRKWREAAARKLLLTVCAGLLVALGGCGATSPNEAEGLKDAPPPAPLKNPNESFRDRKERQSKEAQDRDKELAGKKGSTPTKGRTR